MRFKKENLKYAIHSLFEEQPIAISLPKVYRVVRDTLVSEYGEEAIVSGVGTMKHSSGRWMMKGICYVLYASFTAETAIKEFFSNDKGENKKVVLAEISVNLDRILDLTNKDTVSKLGLTIDDLLKTRYSLQGKQEVLTQIIGRFAYELGFEGMIVPSKANLNGINLVVFSEKTPMKGIKLLDWKLLEA